MNETSQNPNGYVQRSSTPRRAARPIHPDDDLLPPDIDAQGAADHEDITFRSWLASGILDLLGTAAGVTLSTTGRLVAPPLQVTQNILLPALLDLFVHTLDSVTPQKVQDWFRIISSSVHHLMVVLRSTEKGKLFSRQLYVVLSDFLQALSAPESRQVVVESMATSVKLIDAMHTPETKELLEQIAILGVRILDAAGSGKAKQFVQDSKDLAWKGIQMATDPATTVALAEVTAHVCHALEDAHETLNPPNRAKRNAQTESTYISPYQMVDSPEQVSTEEIILSGLGVKVHTGKGVPDYEKTGKESSQNRVRWQDEVPKAPSEINSWQQSKEKVNVDLLQESILRNKRMRTPKPEDHTQPPGTLQSILAKKLEESNGTGEEESSPPPDIEDINGSHADTNTNEAEKDIETRVPLHETFIPPPVLEFYEKLDEFLELHKIEKSLAELTINTKQSDLQDSEEKNQRQRKSRARKLNRQEPSDRKVPMPDMRRSERSLPRVDRHEVLLLLMTAASVGLIILILCLALFGLFSLLKIALGGQGKVNQELNEETIGRIVREIVRMQTQDIVCDARNA